MSTNIIINESNKIPSSFPPETKEDYNFSNSTKISENLPQTNHLLKKKRGRKTYKTDYKVHDRDSPDNIKRKVKTHFHNFIIALLNMKIGQFLQKEVKFGKIASKITQDLTVEYNQKLFQTKIKDIIVVMSDKYSNKNRNKIILNEIMKKIDKNSELLLLLNLNYEEIFLKFYLKSNKETFNGEEEDESYEAHIKKLTEKYGNEYANNFKSTAESLINFFYKCKKRNVKKKLKAPSFVNIYDSEVNYNDKIFPPQKSFCTKETQTDFLISDSEDADY